jgi:lipopolysaccharide cholinephosphotransferase
MEDLSHYNPEGSDLRKAQMRMLEILDVFDGICRKHSINYWLDWGTLLGARRHGGFIPWDDDLDVTILLSDYKKLVSVLKEELPGNLKLQSRETDKKYFYYFPKIRDTESCLSHKNDFIFDYNGIYVDIFLIEPVPSIGFKKIIDGFLRSGYEFKDWRHRYRKSKKNIYAIMSCFLPLIRSIIWLLRLYYKHIGSSKVYSYVYGTFTFTFATFYPEDIFPTNEIMFEGKKYMAPLHVDKYLINQYGSTFMDIPKAANRRTHATKIEFF